jgi:hypothetical protein
MFCTGKVDSFKLITDGRNQRLSMQTNELEMLSQRIKEAEERLRIYDESKKITEISVPADQHLQSVQ